MRIDVKKMLFFGAPHELDSFFRKAQQAGMIHFLKKESLSREVPLDMQHIHGAIKVLRGLPTLKQEELDSYAEADSLAEKILELKQGVDKLKEEKRVTLLEIERISPFGDFSFEDISFIEENGDRKFRFFFAKKGLFAREDLPEELFFVGSDHGMDFYVAIEKEPLEREHLIEMRFDESLHEMKARVERVNQEIRELERQLKQLQKYHVYLHHAFADRWNRYSLQDAKNGVSMELEGKIFAIQGWVPKNKGKQLEEILNGCDIQAEPIALEPGEEPPTYLENQGFSRVGEDLVHIYDTPSPSDKDPSMWVLLAFALFFAMIIGDGGYGLVFLGTLLYVRSKMKKPTKAGKRMLRLGALLTAFCIGWGVLTNSFFGIHFAYESPMRKVSLINFLAKEKAEYHFEKKDDVYKTWVEKYPDLKDADDSTAWMAMAKKGESYEMLDTFTDNIMMELALLVGAIHICLSFLRYIRRNWAGAGWILFIAGCYFYFPFYLKATSFLHYALGMNPEILGEEGLLMIYVGIALAFLLSLAQNRLYGLLEPTTLIQVFGDVLSYLRLYALALASGIISKIVNDAAWNISWGEYNFMFLGALLLVLGHSLNIILSIIGGVIHGLRLNFIEWYHYSFEGGGKLFSPLRKMEIEGESS